MPFYGQLKMGAPERPFAEMREHSVSQPLTLVLEADPNNPNAVAYASAINRNMQLLEKGGDNLPLADLPPLDDPNAVHFSFRDRNGHTHFKNCAEKSTEQLRSLIRSGQNVQTHMSEEYHRFKDAYKQAMSDAPSDHTVSGFKNQRMVKVKEGFVVVNADDPKAVAWLEKYKHDAVTADGSVDLEKIPKMDFDKKNAEFHPPPGASPELVKEANAFNKMFHQGIDSLCSQYRANHATANQTASAQSVARSSIAAHHP